MVGIIYNTIIRAVRATSFDVGCMENMHAWRLSKRGDHAYMAAMQRWGYAKTEALHTWRVYGRAKDMWEDGVCYLKGRTNFENQS